MDKDTFSRKKNIYLKIDILNFSENLRNIFKF